MTGHPIKVVYFKEMRDLLRDRRTIISMIVVPMFVLPGLMVLIGMMANRIVGQARQALAKVMLLGGEDSPETVAALRQVKTLQIIPCRIGLHKPDFREKNRRGSGNSAGL